MNEITKPNDMLVSTLVNGNVSTLDLLSHGINAGNTQLLDPQSYKESKLIKQKFTDENGNFNTDEFNKVYIAAAKQYSDLAEMNTYDKLSKYIEYNQKDIFAPLDANRNIPTYEIEKELNPLRLSHGVDSLFDFGQQTKSMRELAQQSKIWDYDNKVWLDKTPEDRGLLGSIFGRSLVYATYDEDTDEEDPLTGRIIHHKKGEWKLNDKGQYYTETIGNRSGYGKQFVAAGDTLTKEDSALNKIDFFDSDDIEKSAVGTIVLTAAKILPYIFPQTRLVFGGATAALEMAKVFPTFAKMIEGIVIGGDNDNETGFTRAMNSWENYFGKFSQSYSDKGMESNWSGEKLLDQVTDIFSQLYQMRAAASLSKLAMKDPTRQAVKNFQDKILPRFIEAGLTENSGIALSNPKTMQEILQIAAEKSPEVIAAIKAQSKLSKALSVGYMALSSSADVYSDALAGGYDRRMAGLAGLAATAGQFFIMTKEDALNLGGWFLDDSVGYHEGAMRSELLKALRPYYDEIAKSVQTLDQAASKEEKIGIIQKVLSKASKGLKETKLGIRSGGEYLKNGIRESLEEVTEEAVMDATKGIFDFLTWAGLGSNKNASFGVVEDFKSGSFLDRYLQNVLGGFMGGALFEFQQNKIEPWMNKVMYGKVKEEVQPSLIHQIANGHIDDLYKAIDELAELDSDVAAIPIDVDGNKFAVSADGQLTRGQATAKILKDYVKVLEGVMIGENTNLTDDQLLEKAIRDYQAISILKKGGLDKMLIADFTKLSSEIASIKIALDEAEKKKEEDKKSTEEKQKEQKEATTKAKKDVEEFFDDGNYSGKPAEYLKELLKKKREELNQFLNGEKAEFYTYKTLVGAVPEIKNALGDLSIYDYTFLKYNKEFRDLKRSTGTVNQASVEKEYNEWKKLSNADEKFIRLGVEAYQDFDTRFSKYIYDYIKTGYGDVRKVTRAKLLSRGNLKLTDLLDDNNAYQSIKKIANLQKETGSGNITLEDIFTQDELLLTEDVKKILAVNPNTVRLLELTGKSSAQIEQELVQFLAGQLGSINVDVLSEDTLSALINQFIVNSLDQSLDRIIDQLPNKTLGELYIYLENEGLLNTQTILSPEQAAITDKQVLQEFFQANAMINNVPEVSIGLASSLLNKYITSEDVIDGVVRQRIEQEACRDIIRDLNSNEDIIKSEFNNLASIENILDLQSYSFSISSNDLKELIDQINNNFGNKEIDKIIEEWAKNIASKWIESVDLDNSYESSFSQLKVSEITPEKISSKVSDFIKNIVNSNKLYKLYNQVKSKQSKENPLYDGLSKIDLRLSESVPSKVLEVLKNQHDKLRAAERFEDYLPQSEIKIQIENALRAVNLLKALIVGKREGALGFGSPFAVNQQMQRFIEKNKIKSDKNYDTIDEESGYLMLQDLNIIEQQLKGYLTLGEKAYTSKVGQDQAIKKKYSKLLLDTINQKATAFTIHDFSLLPPENERNQFENNPEQALVYYAHTIFKNFKDHFKTLESRRDAIHELIQNLNIDKDSINRGSRPSNLNREVTFISDYDLIMWIATSLGADANEFYYRYNQLIVSNDKNKNTPLFSQEQAALQAWSFLRDESNVKGENGNISVHDTITEELLLINPNLKGIPTSRLFFINGITGAGKSTVVGSIVSQLCSDKLIYVTAANQKQVDNYVPMIKKYYPEKDAIQSGGINTLLSKFFGQDNLKQIYSQVSQMLQVSNLDEYYKTVQDNAYFDMYKVDGSKLSKLNENKLIPLLLDKIDVDTIPEIVLIDEGTQVPQPILQIINFLAKKYNFKVIVSGDSTQRGAKLESDTQAFNDLFMWKSAKLNISVRSANNQVATNNFEFNKLLEKYEEISINLQGQESQDQFRTVISDPTNQIAISYYQDENTFNGYKFVEDLSNFTEDIKLIGRLNKEANAKDPKHAKKVMIITDLDKKGNPTNSNIIQILAQCELLQGDYEFLSPDDTHDLAVQGSESRYVIVDGNAIKQDAKELPGEVLRSVYTFASRAQNGTLMQLTEDQQNAIGIRNRKDKITQIDEIPQLRDVDKLKETRKAELEQIIGKYKPEKIELDKLKQKEQGDKKVYIRSNSIPKANTTQQIKKSTTTPNVAEIDYESEENLPDDIKDQYITTLNQEIPDKLPSNVLNSTTGDESLKPEKSNTSPKTSVRMYPAINHIGIKKEGPWYIHNDSGNNLDMDGLFDPNRRIKQEVHDGFIRFQHLLLAAKSKEEIVEGIRSDELISFFLFNACPMVAHSHDENYDVTWQDNERMRNRYADWFKENVDIDENYYIFGEKLNWETDKPSTLVNARIEDSVGEGQTVLYFGVRVHSKDGLLNQYISIGTMSDMKTKSGIKLESPELQELYRRAGEDLQDTKFVVYRLPNTSTTYREFGEGEGIKLSSTLMIRSILDQETNDVKWDQFESIDQMKQRGFDIDTDHIYLVDDSKVLINGKSEFKILVFLAQVGRTFADVNKSLSNNKLSFEERLEKLKKTFISPEGDLRIKGSYVTFARYLKSSEVNNYTELKRSAYNRVVFLNPKKSTGRELFESDGFKYQSDIDSKRQDIIKQKLALCRPASQSKMITSLLMQGKAFEDLSTLKKYLLGMRMKLLASSSKNYYKRDKDTLEILIRTVEQKILDGQNFTPREFLDLLNQHGHRILLYPFFLSFCYKSGSDYILRNASNFTIETKNGVDIINLDKKKTTGDIIINLDQLPESVACPPLLKLNINDEEYKGLFESFGYELPEGLSEDFKMLQISFTSNSGKYLGMYGYQLQAPIVQIQNEQIRVLERVTDRLEQLKKETKVDEITGSSYVVDPRFPKRGIWSDIPERPVDFVPEDYIPTTLKDDDYFVDTSDQFAKYIRYRKGKPTGEYEKEFKKGKWVYKKDKNGKRIPKYEKVFIGYGTTKENGQFTKLTVFNKQGFEIRPGDYVQLWGDTSRSYYVETIDVTAKDGPMLHLTHYGEPDGRGGKSIMEPLSDVKSGKRITIEAVTKVVKRTVADKKHISGDIYRTGKFNVLPKYKQGKYILPEKTLGTMLEMIDAVEDGEDVPTLDFDKSWFYLVPTYKENLEDGGINSPLRSHNDQTVGGEIIESVQGLRLASEKLSDKTANPDIAGYTLFRIYRKTGYTPQQQITLDFVENIKDDITRAAMLNKHSEWIGHQVIFDDQIAESLIKELQPANISDVKYDRLEIARNLPKPEDHLVFNEDGTLNKEKSAQFNPEGIILTRREYESITASDKFPDKQWMREKIIDENNEISYRYFPRPWFLFSEEQKKVLDPTDKTLVTSDAYDRFISRGNTTSGGIAKDWDNILRGYVFKDYQVYAYDPPIQTQDKSKNNEDKKNREAKRSELNRNLSNRSDLNPIGEFVITGCNWDNNKLYLYYINNPNPGEKMDERTERKIELKEFIFFLGTRFQFVANANRQEIGAPVTAPKSVYTFNIPDTIEINTVEDNPSYNSEINNEKDTEIDLENDDTIKENIEKILKDREGFESKLNLDRTIGILIKLRQIQQNMQNIDIKFDENFVIKLSEILSDDAYATNILSLISDNSLDSKVKIRGILYAVSRKEDLEEIASFIEAIIPADKKENIDLLLNEYKLNIDRKTLLNCY